MTPTEQFLTDLAEEAIRLRTHPTGPSRYIPVGDPAASVNASLWAARGNWWYRDPNVAAVALAHELGLWQGRAEAELKPAKVTGRIESKVIQALETLAATGALVTVAAVVAATVQAMPIPAGQRDRRREFAKRAFTGLVVRGALAVTDGSVTARLTRNAAGGAK